MSFLCRIAFGAQSQSRSLREELFQSLQPRNGLEIVRLGLVMMQLYHAGMAMAIPLRNVSRGLLIIWEEGLTGEHNARAVLLRVFAPDSIRSEMSMAAPSPQGGV